MLLGLAHGAKKEAFLVMFWRFLTKNTWLYCLVGTRCARVRGIGAHAWRAIHRHQSRWRRTDHAVARVSFSQLCESQ